MINVVELNNKELNRCNSCSSHTSSMPKEIDEIMGSKVADKIFELSFRYSNVISTVRLCDECLKELKNKIDEIVKE